MKNIILATILSIFVLNSTGQQQLLLPKPPNMSSKLIHTFTVLGPKKQAYSARKLRNSVYELMQFEEMDINMVNTLEELPDVVFVINDSTAEAQSLIKQVHMSGAIMIPIEPNNMREPIRNVSDINIPETKLASYEGQLTLLSYIMRFLYYSGKRPSYTTVFGEVGENYTTYGSPSVIKTSNGTLIAFAQAYPHSTNHLSSNDIVVRISNDGGLTWGAIKPIASTVNHNLINPTAIYSESNNRVVLMFQEMPERGVDGKFTNDKKQFISTFSCHSSNNGKTWSKAVDITNQVRIPNTPSYGCGPGVGICVQGGPNNGRLIVPFYSNSGFNWFNYLVYSDDMGNSWKIAPGHSTYGANESQIVQLSPTEFLVNASSYRLLNDYTSYFTPKGWNPTNYSVLTRNRIQLPLTMVDSTAIWGDLQMMINQPDPIGQGSIIRFKNPRSAGDSILIMSNPASQHSWLQDDIPYMSTVPMRINGSIKVSFDNGITWPISNRIYGNRYTSFQNSVLVQLDQQQIGCIFDSNENIKFAIVDFQWLCGEKGRDPKFKSYFSTVWN